MKKTLLLSSFPLTEDQQLPSSILRRSLLLFFSIFILTGSVISGLMMVFYRSETNTRLIQVKTQEMLSVNLQSKVVDNLLDSITADLFFLSHQNELHEYLTEEDPTLLDKVASEYLHFSARKKVYDQIRFLDENGMEIVRVNYNQGEPVKISPDKLQSKKRRYYFTNCFQRNQGEIFLSPFDLNIENGQLPTA